MGEGEQEPVLRLFVAILFSSLRRPIPYNSPIGPTGPRSGFAEADRRMELDTLWLSRLQFALTIMFHYLFPPLSIGLGMLMVFMEGLYLRTKDPQYSQMTRFWTKIFAVNFAVGVATGIVMEFQFGTNWARYARFTGDVFGSALAAEGIFAFFLESGFLAVLVFGWDRVSAKMHFFATCMVALGSTFSAVWIVIANSWMHTPAGSHIVEHTVNGVSERRAEIVNFWALVFNPSSMERLLHVILGAYMLGAFFVLSISAWYLLGKRHEAFARKCFLIALTFGTASTCAMMLSGHSQAKKLATTQPAKLAAFEGHYHTGTGGTPMYAFGWVDEKNETVYGLYAPWALSAGVYIEETAPIAGITEGLWNKPVRGLDQVDKDQRPPVGLVFQTYHAMVGMGVFMLVLLLYSCWLWWRGLLFERRWLLWVYVFAVAAPYIANQTGWVSAEVGRQPYVVYPKVDQVGFPDKPGEGKIVMDETDAMRTANAYSGSVKGHQVLTSVVMFSLVYLLLFVLWVRVLHAKISHGPEMPVQPPAETKPEALLDAAALRADPAGDSLSDAEQPGPSLSVVPPVSPASTPAKSEANRE